MKYIKKYDRFVEGTETAPSPSRPAPTTKPGTPAKPRPTRPGIIPGKRPSEEDAPLAELKQKGPEASLKDISDRVFKVAGEDGVKKLIK